MHVKHLQRFLIRLSTACVIVEVKEHVVLVCSEEERKTGKIVVAKQADVFKVIENFGDHQFCKPKSKLPVDILSSLPEIREAVLCDKTKAFKQAFSRSIAPKSLSPYMAQRNKTCVSKPLEHGRGDRFATCLTLSS